MGGASILVLALAVAGQAETGAKPQPSRVYPIAPPAPPTPPAPPQSSAPIGARPVNPVISYFSADDYPAAALRAGEEGIVSYRLHIAPDGFVGRCEVTQSSGSEVLDAATCRIIRSRIRYVPAQDWRGAFVPDSTTGSISWRFPDEPDPPAEPEEAPVPPLEQTPPAAFAPTPPLVFEPPPGAPQRAHRAVPRRPFPDHFTDSDYPAAALREGAEGRVGFLLTVGADGRVGDCSVTESSGSLALDEATCRILRARAEYVPALDDAGEAATDFDRGSFTWRLPGG